MKINSSTWASALYQSINSHPENSQKTVRTFLQKLSQKRQRKLLPSILRQMTKIEDQNTVTVKTKYKIDQTQILEFKKISQKYFPEINSPQVKNVIDTAIIGGFKISSGEKEIDATVLTKINKLKEYSWKII